MTLRACLESKNSKIFQLALYSIFVPTQNVALRDQLFKSDSILSRSHSIMSSHVKQYNQCKRHMLHYKLFRTNRQIIIYTSWIKKPNAHLFCRFASIWVYRFGFPKCIARKSGCISLYFMLDKIQCLPLT